MFSFDVRNVHEALPIALDSLRRDGVHRGSRNGPVLQFPRPVMTTYQRPLERVIFHPERDANPFFHLMEALWMLAGRNDVAFLSEFNSNMESFSDDGNRFHGAYGYRWRTQFGLNQLKRVTAMLRKNPEDRRQVISMWDGSIDLSTTSKDLPCNTHAYVQVSDVGRVDLTVCNRSNDLIWGAYGANAVHFSFLLEYLAASIGLPVGVYNQFSVNTHVYLERHGELLDVPLEHNPFYDDLVMIPLVNIPIHDWDSQLLRLLAAGPPNPNVTEPFFRDIVLPIWRSWRAYKTEGTKEERVQRALDALSTTMYNHNDWVIACNEWLQRRLA